MGASALIFSVMMPCKGHKKRVPNFGNDCFSHFCGFPMLGTTIFDVFACSQHWEQLFFFIFGRSRPRERWFLSFSAVPDLGNNVFNPFCSFPRSGTSVLDSIWHAQNTLKSALIGMDATNSQHFASLVMDACTLTCAQSYNPNQSPCAVFYDQLLLLFIERELFLG